MCHGDIKLENVMVSSWNWLLLADFATVKPTLLPEDDPANYTYFFDTSRRRICYIAPERFVLFWRIYFLENILVIFVFRFYSKRCVQRNLTCLYSQLDFEFGSYDIIVSG